MSPLLFLIYANDIQECSEKLQFFLFADDINILYADSNLKTLEKIVNLELRKLCDWLTAIKLTLNVKKLISSYFVQPKENLLSNLIFDNDKNICVSLERKVFVRYLGP